MDIEEYFKTVEFKPVGKDGHFYILEARINTGEEIIVRVISLNKKKHLHEMKWKKLWGLPTQIAMDHHKLQCFTSPVTSVREKTLTVQERNIDACIYMHDEFPYIITIPNGNGYDQFAREDRLTLGEVLGFPQYEVRRFK